MKNKLYLCSRDLNFENMSIDKNKHLREVLDTHKMHHVQDFVDKVKARREEVKSMMHDHYGNDKYSSFCSGSFAKHMPPTLSLTLTW